MSGNKNELNIKRNYKWRKRRGMPFLNKLNVAGIGKRIWCGRNKTLLDVLILENDQLQSRTIMPGWITPWVVTSLIIFAIAAHLSVFHSYLTRHFNYRP